MKKGKCLKEMCEAQGVTFIDEPGYRCDPADLIGLPVPSPVAWRVTTSTTEDMLIRSLKNDLKALQMWADGEIEITNTWLSNFLTDIKLNIELLQVERRRKEGIIGDVWIKAMNRPADNVLAWLNSTKRYSLNRKYSIDHLPSKYEVDKLRYL